MDNLFLTEIAKDYNPLIENVSCIEIEKKDLSGFVFKRERGTYRIYLDPGKRKCSYQIIFDLFHEIGHVMLGHLDDNKLGYYTREGAANLWAFRELNIIDQENEPMPDYVECLKCISTNSRRCINKNVYIHKTLQTPEFFYCNKAKCRLRLSVCIKRQKYFIKNIVEGNYDLSVCEGCSRRRNQCRLNLPVCLKSPKSVKRVTSKDTYIICKKCPQGIQNLNTIQEKYVQK